jgi:AsmA protein
MTVAAIVTLLVLAIVSVVLWVDPNRFRAPIERAAREKLGVPLRLTGDLHWRLWPLLSIEAGAGSMPPLLRWTRVRLSAQWRALWQQQLQIDGVTIDGLEVTLQRDRTGHANWQGWMTPVAPGGAPASAQIDELELLHGAVHYADDLAGAQWTATELHLNTALVFEPAGRLTLRKPTLSMQIRGGTLPAAGVPVAFQTLQLVYQLEPALVTVAPLRAQLANATLAVSVSQPLQPGSLAATGSAEIDTRALRSTLAMLGITAPPTSDPAVLGPLHVTSQWRTDATKIELSALNVQLDDTTLQGTVMWPFDADAQARLELGGDKLNLDRYQRPTDNPGEPFKLPVEALRALRVQGVVTFDEVRAGGVIARGARFRLESDD